MQNITVHFPIIFAPYVVTIPLHNLSCLKKVIASALHIFRVTNRNTQIWKMEVSCTKICLIFAESPVKYDNLSIFQGAPFLEKDIVKKLTLAGVAQLIGYCPMHLRGCQFNSQSDHMPSSDLDPREGACRRQAMLYSHINVSLALLFLPLPLKNHCEKYFKNELIRFI